MCNSCMIRALLSVLLHAEDDLSRFLCGDENCALLSIKKFHKEYESEEL